MTTALRITGFKLGFFRIMLQNPHRCYCRVFLTVRCFYALSISLNRFYCTPEYLIQKANLLEAQKSHFGKKVSPSKHRTMNVNRYLKQHDVFNRTWWSVLSTDKLINWQHISVEMTSHHVVLKASSCLRSLLTMLGTHVSNFYFIHSLENKNNVDIISH